MSNPSVNKRLKERNRQEKQREKAEKRAQRSREKATRPAGEPGVDPDIAGIIPGPQPREEDADEGPMNQSGRALPWPSWGGARRHRITASHAHAQLSAVASRTRRRAMPSSRRCRGGASSRRP